MEKISFSIVTPTYNRAHLLSRLYESLIVQKNNNFEWIVINDGSTDNTKEIIEAFQKQGLINILYLEKSNGGKHSALNLGLSYCCSDLTLILDSDDVLPDWSLLYTSKLWHKVRHNKRLAGIIGLCSEITTGEVIGDIFPKSPFISSIVKNIFCFNIKGDKCDFIRTEYIRDLRLPEKFNEKFVPESIITYELDRNFRYLCVNKNLKLVEYQQEGITKNFRKMILNSPNSYFLRFEHLLDNSFLSQMNLKGKLKIFSNYFRFYFKIEHDSHKAIDWSLMFTHIHVMIPSFICGLIYHISDLFFIRGNQ